MSNSEAEDWLSAAAATVEHLPLDILDAACAEARRRCTHHSQVVPAIIAAGEARLESRQQTARLALLQPSLPAPARPKPQPMTQTDVDRLSPEFVRLGLKAGFLIKDGDGSVRLAPENQSQQGQDAE